MHFFIFPEISLLFIFFYLEILRFSQSQAPIELAAKDATLRPLRGLQAHRGAWGSRGEPCGAPCTAAQGLLLEGLGEEARFENRKMQKDLGENKQKDIKDRVYIYVFIYIYY